ncbi:GspH/FimT family pseudopilin [Marinagarivorans cellulosilyticus]|uniref:Type II secretion system protein H n=1 Tax=Marinagarivorans cellulosilyticus TaxID=2721545 RepID=A0AAN2BLY8_9GAMM|nr:GspH/FimT family pseudopilin [Marinagarivorans cellulosilyticus]BCD99527.1 type IV fimbrial biogenesis protein FimT [Marinagarivorans cellulosilyticus]
MKSYKGVTLIEMMIAIAIASILLAVAAPSFRTMIIRYNIDALVDDFTVAVTTARSEAASRGLEVRVCANEDCDATTWVDGWFVIDANDSVIQVFNNDGRYPITVTTETAATVTAITFNAAGYNRDEERYVFSACEPGGGAGDRMMRGVTVEFSGRAYQTDFAGTLQKARFDKGEGGTTGNDRSEEVNLNCN